MEQTLLMAGKVLYVQTTPVEVCVSWMALIASISSMVQENVKQIAASHQSDLFSLAPKIVK